MEALTARFVLELLQSGQIDLDKPVWIGTTIPGLHETTKAWDGADGSLHLTDEEGE